MSEESWMPVVGYEGWYSVSDKGRVRRDAAARGTRAGHILKVSVGNNGYVYVALCRNGIRHICTVHRLVMGAFVGPRPPGLDINHKDGVKVNNSLCNLEYVTRSENERHAYRSGLMPPPIHAPVGSANGRAKLTEAGVRQIKAALARGEKRSALAQNYGVTIWAIHDIAQGRNWRHVA